VPTITPPDYEGGSLVNLVAELEYRLTGAAPSPRLRPELAAAIPDAAAYLLVLYDGLGASQLYHPEAGSLRASQAGILDSPFPATTTVSLATVATGLPPSQHGLLGYQLWLPEVDEVVNTIKWTTLWGAPVEVDHESFLPGPNLWERLTGAGVDPVTVQPAAFAGTGLTRTLYRGCRFAGVTLLDEQIATTLRHAADGRWVFTYHAAVDFAAHVHGQDTAEYAAAVAAADHLWARLAAELPPGVVMVGTADHGHIDFPRERQVKIAKPDHAGRLFYGDGRAMFVKGEGAALAARLPATWVPIEEAAAWWGPPPAHPSFAARRPDGILLADDDVLLLHRFSDDRMVGNHGAMTAPEREIPLLVAAR
jgi:hypothetical protein